MALLIEREGREGPYVEGMKERFRLVTSNEALRSVRWSASAGILEPEAEHVTWTLPAAGTASLSVIVETESGGFEDSSFNFNVVPAPLAADAMVDSSADVTGRTCELAFDNAGKGHIIYTNETHGSLWYGSWDGTAWTLEQIDGPGFSNTGGFIHNPALVLDPASGTPHVTYLKGALRPASSLRLWYATRAASAWTRENVDVTSRPLSAQPSIALNPALGLRPVIVIGESTALQIATRTAANTWNSTLAELTSSTSTKRLVGNIAFDAAGTLYLPFFPVGGPSPYLAALKGTATELLRIESFDNASSQAAMVWGPSQHLLLLANGSESQARAGLQDITLATPLSTSTVTVSQVDSENDASDLAYAGKPYIALRRDNTLELVTTNAQNFWTYTQLGTAEEGSRPSVAVRPTDGVPHVCYQREGKVSFQ